MENRRKEKVPRSYLSSLQAQRPAWDVFDFVTQFEEPVLYDRLSLDEVDANDTGGGWIHPR